MYTLTFESPDTPQKQFSVADNVQVIPVANYARRADVFHKTGISFLTRFLDISNIYEPIESCDAAAYPIFPAERKRGIFFTIAGFIVDLEAIARFCRGSTWNVGDVTIV